MYEILVWSMSLTLRAGAKEGGGYRQGHRDQKALRCDKACNALETLCT